MEPIDRIIIRSLRSFLAYINQKEWFGRENEAVNLYAFGFLQRECSNEGPLIDPTQIGIEVGAADTPKSVRSQVRKDIVIWPEPGVNRWYPASPRTEPLAIMEWKVQRPNVRPSKTQGDIAWLLRHCSSSTTIGYSVLLDLRNLPARLTAVRVTSAGVRDLEV